MGDTRGDDNPNTGVSTYLPAIASKISTLNPSAVFVAGDLINGGKIADHGDYTTQFGYWKTAMKSVSDASIPIYTVRGNHESSVTDGGEPSTALHDAYYAAFGSTTPTVGSPVPQNGPNNGPTDDQRGFTWNILLNNVRMIGIDQYFYYSPTKQGDSNYYQIDQAWLNQQLNNAAPARFTFVMAHEPIYYLNGHGDFYGSTTAAGEAERQVFWNSLGSNGVRMYLCCHVHNVQIGNTQDSSGNTIWQNVTGNGGAPLDPQDSTDPSLAITHQDFTNYGFQLYTVKNNSIIITSYLYNADANIWSIDSYLINLSYYSDFATNRNAMALAHLLDSTDGNGTDFANLLTALANLNDADVGNAINALLPVVDGSVLEVTNASFDKFMSTIISHMNSPRPSDAKADPTIWAQGYGGYLHEAPRDLSNGYDASILGTTIGIEAISNCFRLGVAGGYGHDFIRSKDNSGRNDVNNYQWTVYGGYAKDAYYLDTACAFAYNTYNASRHVIFPGFDQTPKGDYDGEQYLGYVEAGYTVKYKKLEVTPLASFQYSHLHLREYTETGGAGADFSYKAQDYDFAQTGFGAKIDYPFDTKYGTLIPELRFKWLYDWVGDTAQTTATFTGGGASFQTTGFSPAQSSFDIGTKLTLVSENSIAISVNYDLQLQNDLYGHYGYFEARYSF